MIIDWFWVRSRNQKIGEDRIEEHDKVGRRDVQIIGQEMVIMLHMQNTSDSFDNDHSND